MSADFEPGRRLSTCARPAVGPRWTARGPASMRGYTLIEVIVAFALLALALTLLLGRLSNAARQEHRADGAGRATLYAQSLLDQAGGGEPLEAGTHTGSFENERYHWTLDVRRYVDPGKGAVAATADGAQLFQLDLRMDWGPAAAQKLQLQTLRLSRSTNVPEVP